LRYDNPTLIVQETALRTEQHQLYTCTVVCVILMSSRPTTRRFEISRAGHFRYKYQYFDIQYLTDTEKIIEISDLKSIRVLGIVLQISTSDTPILY
jgi:hypothetical protein